MGYLQRIKAKKTAKKTGENKTNSLQHRVKALQLLQELKARRELEKALKIREKQEKQQNLTLTKEQLTKLSTTKIKQQSSKTTPKITQWKKQTKTQANKTPAKTIPKIATKTTEPIRKTTTKLITLKTRIKIKKANNERQALTKAKSHSVKIGIKKRKRGNVLSLFSFFKMRKRITSNLKMQSFSDSKTRNKVQKKQLIKNQEKSDRSKSSGVYDRVKLFMPRKKLSQDIKAEQQVPGGKVIQKLFEKAEQMKLNVTKKQVRGSSELRELIDRIEEDKKKYPRVFLLVEKSGFSDVLKLVKVRDKVERFRGRVYANLLIDKYSEVAEKLSEEQQKELINGIVLLTQKRVYAISYLKEVDKLIKAGDKEYADYVVEILEKFALSGGEPSKFSEAIAKLGITKKEEIREVYEATSYLQELNFNPVEFINLINNELISPFEKQEAAEKSALKDLFNEIKQKRIKSENDLKAKVLVIKLFKEGYLSKKDYLYLLKNLPSSSKKFTSHTLLEEENFLIKIKKSNLVNEEEFKNLIFYLKLKIDEKNPTPALVNFYKKNSAPALVSFYGELSQDERKKVNKLIKKSIELRKFNESLFKELEFEFEKRLRTKVAFSFEKLKSKMREINEIIEEQDNLLSIALELKKENKESVEEIVHDKELTRKLRALKPTEKKAVLNNLKKLTFEEMKQQKEIIKELMDYPELRKKLIKPNMRVDEIKQVKLFKELFNEEEREEILNYSEYIFRDVLKQAIKNEDNERKLKNLKFLTDNITFGSLNPATTFLGEVALEELLNFDEEELKRLIKLTDQNRELRSFVDNLNVLMIKGLKGEQSHKLLELTYKLVEKKQDVNTFLEASVIFRDTLSRKHFEKFLKIKELPLSVLSEEIVRLKKGWVNKPYKQLELMISEEMREVFNSYIISRSKNRARELIIPLMRDEKVAEQIQAIIRNKLKAGEKIGKRQIKELPSIAQKLQLLNALFDKEISIQETDLKKLNKQLQDEIVKTGTQEFGENFEIKYKQLQDQHQEQQLVDMVVIIRTLENHYKTINFKKVKNEVIRTEKEQEALKQIMNAWLAGIDSFKEYKYKELDEIGVPEKLQDKWKQTTTITMQVGKESTEDKIEEVIKRLEESKQELTAENQEKHQEEYNKIQKLIEEQEYGKAQNKIQELIKQITEENSDASKHLQYAAGLLAKTNEKEAVLKASDEADVVSWFNIGKEFNTCQSYLSKGRFNPALVSFIGDATKKPIIIINTETGKMEARAVMYLTKNSSGEWELYLDDIYSHNTQAKQLILKFYEQKAKELGIPMVKKPHKIIGKVPFTYMNNNGGLRKQEVI